MLVFFFFYFRRNRRKKDAEQIYSKIIGYVHFVIADGNEAEMKQNSLQYWMKCSNFLFVAKNERVNAQYNRLNEIDASYYISFEFIYNFMMVDLLFEAIFRMRFLR